MKLEGRTEARHLDETPLPPRLASAPRAGPSWRRGTRQAEGAGRGRAASFEHRSSRSTPAPAGAAETGRVVTTRKRRAVRSSPGLPLTSLRRLKSAVAGLLLLPPLLLTSTSLCRKVDPAPRPTHTQRRKRSSEVWDQASGEGKEEGGGEGWEERDVTTSRGRKAAPSLAEETWRAAALPKTTRPRMPRGLGRARWAGFGESAAPSKRRL